MYKWDKYKNLQFKEFNLATSQIPLNVKLFKYHEIILCSMEWAQIFSLDLLVC